MEKGLRQWDKHKLENMLGAEDADLARQMILSKYAPNDTYIWRIQRIRIIR